MQLITQLGATMDLLLVVRVPNFSEPQRRSFVVAIAYTSTTYNLNTPILVRNENEENSLANTHNSFLICGFPPRLIQILRHGILTTSQRSREASSRYGNWKAKSSCHAQQEASCCGFSNSRSIWKRGSARRLRRPDESAREE